MSEAKPEAPTSAQLASSSENPLTTTLSRRQAGKIILGVAGGLMAAAVLPEVVSAQSETKKDKKPESMFPVKPVVSSSVRDISLLKDVKNTSQVLAAEAAANQEVFYREVDELITSMHKALPVNTQKTKVTYQTNALDNVAFPTVEPKTNLTPEIQVFTQNNNPETLETALLLTGDAVGLVLDQSYGGKFSSQMSGIYHNIMNNLIPKERDALMNILDLTNYVKGPKVEIQDSTEDTAAWAYARSLSLGRLRSEEVIENLKKKGVPPAVREGVSLLILTAIQSTVTRSDGQIPPKDLGFNVGDINEFVKMGGNKVLISNPPGKPA